MAESNGRFIRFEDDGEPIEGVAVAFPTPLRPVQSDYDRYQQPPVQPVSPDGVTDRINIDLYRYPDGQWRLKAEGRLSNLDSLPNIFNATAQPGLPTAPPQTEQPAPSVTSLSPAARGLSFDRLAGVLPKLKSEADVVPATLPDSSDEASVIQETGVRDYSTLKTVGKRVLVAYAITSVFFVGAHSAKEATISLVGSAASHVPFIGSTMKKEIALGSDPYALNKDPMHDVATLAMGGINAVKGVGHLIP